MNIVVCMKYIGTLPGYMESHLPFSSSDLNALGMGLDLKTKHENSKLIVISMSPYKAKDSMQDLYSYGVDSVYLISDKSYVGSDTLATTFVLSLIIKKIMKTMKMDIILCGDKTSDSSTGQIAAGLAYRLQGQYCNCLQNIVLTNNNYMFITTHYTLENYNGLVIADVNNKWELPFPSIQNILCASEKKVICWSNEDLKADLNKVGASGSPTKIIEIQEDQPKVFKNIILEDSNEAKLFLKHIIGSRGGDLIDE